MKTHRAKKDGNAKLELYRTKMERVGFMQSFQSEPQIFNFGSPKFKNFIIHTFTSLHADFHYLSFLNGEDIDQELIKIAEILQILPNNFCKKNSNVFDDWNETEIHKFWMKLFAVSDIEINESYINDDSFALDNKLDFLRGMYSTLHYLQYDYPVLNAKKLSEINLNEEIAKWNDETTLEIEPQIKESSTYNFETDLVFNMNPEKLINDLKHIITMYEKSKIVKEEPKCEEIKLFQNLINLTEEVLKYSEHLNLIEFKTLCEVYEKYVEFKNQNVFTNNIHFIKTYGSLVNILKSKVKLFY